MHGGGRLDEFVTTDLLDVWTDAVTAMEAVGASRGRVREPVAEVRRALSTDSPLRGELYALLLELVDRGELEKRATTDGWYAFRRRDAQSAPAPFEADIDLTVEPEPRSQLLAEPERPVVAAAEAETIMPRRDPVRRWPRVVAPAAPLLFPAISCVLAIVAFVWLDQVGGLLIAAGLTIVGVIGILRRVPFAGLWILGVLVAGVVLRFS